MLSNSQYVRRATRGLATVLLLASALGAPALAQPRGQDVIIDNPLSGPRFVAHAVRVKALDETGWDWPGSDELWVERWDFAGAVDASYFTDMDSGESKAFPASELCVAPQPACTAGKSSLRFGFMFWEIDDWEVLGILGASFCPGRYHDNSSYERMFDAVTDDDEPLLRPDCDETSADLIGKAKVNLSPAQLVAMLPAVGQSVERTARSAGGSGSYEVTYRITRLADFEAVVNPGSGETAPLTLTATPVEDRRVRLAWSGAITANVDIYRNGAKLVTTANDGDHLDQVDRGTYQYRMCNLASTTSCSPVVSVTVQ